MRGKGKLEKREMIDEIQGRCRNGRHALLPMNSKAAILTEPTLTRSLLLCLCLSHIPPVD